MKFRAVINEQKVLKVFLHSITTLSKLSKECVMIIDENKIIFHINEESNSFAPLVWVEIDCVNNFETYTMKGVDDTHNQIFLLLNPAFLAKALSALRHNVACCKIKLINKQFPCLTIDLEMPSINTIGNRRFLHDIPITLLARGDWPAYILPDIPKSNIQFLLSNIRFIKNVCERFKHLAPSIALYGTNQGDLGIVAETESAMVRSRYLNLNIRSINRDEDNGREFYKVSCVVDSKKIAMFVSSLHTISVEMFIGIVGDHLIDIETELGMGFAIRCIIPAVSV